jgi:hypothetical protein
MWFQRLFFILFLYINGLPVITGQTPWHSILPNTNLRFPDQPKWLDYATKVRFPGLKFNQPVQLVFQKSFAKSLNKKLFNINPLLQLKFPAQETKFRVVSDSKKEKKVGAYSIWVSKKPFLSKIATLKRRQEIEFVFKGGADSVYSNINPHIYLINK